MIIRLFVFFIYNSFKLIALLYQRIYFPDTKVINLKGLDFSGPAIIVSNHPNTMIDPIQVVSRTPRRSSFLANATMFKHPFANKFLNYFSIPIARPGRDDGSRKIDNKSSFVRSFEHLENGHVIFIAPEGTSVMERHLRPLKTGTARIILGAEQENNFELGCRIIPVGVNYEHPSQCGSRLLIKVGEPLWAKDWKEVYSTNQKEAVINMTASLEEQMQALLINTDNEEQDQFLYRLESIWQNDHPQGVLDHHNRTQNLLSGLKVLKNENPSNYEQLQKDTEHYRFQLKAHDLRDRGISNRNNSLTTPISILAWPLWLYGRINNWLAIEIPRWLVGKLGLYKGYNSTVKILSGVFTFPISYFLQYQLVKYFFDQPIPLIYLISLPISAILSRYYEKYITPRLDGWRWRKWVRKEPAKAELLLGARTKLKETTRNWV